MSQLDKYEHMMGKLGIKWGMGIDSLHIESDVIYCDCTKWKAKKLRTWMFLFDIKIIEDKHDRGWLFEKACIKIEGDPSNIRMLGLMIDRMNE